MRGGGGGGGACGGGIGGRPVPPPLRSNGGCAGPKGRPVVLISPALRLRGWGFRVRRSAPTPYRADQDGPGRRGPAARGTGATAYDRPARRAPHPPTV